MRSLNKKTKVKTAKRRKISSTRWLQRQLNDPYVLKAKQDGYLSRAAYKLIQLDDKYQLLKAGRVVVDLGAAPGGWSQVASQRLTKHAKPYQDQIIALDLLPMDYIEGVTNLTTDFTLEEGYQALLTLLDGRKIDLVLSDMAAPTIGHAATDQLRTLALAEIAADFAIEWLSPGGDFVAKLFQGGAGQELLQNLQNNFTKIHHFKPAASRQESAETYIVARNRKG